MKRILLVLSLVFAVIGCGETEATNVNNNGDTRGIDTFGTEINFPDGTGDCETALNPGGDADGDGIINGLEDKNLDCIRDPGETDPTNADTDGDGLSDGAEDINRNGFYDAELGEFDPTSADSNGDGVPDGQDPRAAVCTPDLVNSVNARGAATANANLALPPEYVITPEVAAQGARFSSPAAGVFGYVVKTAGASTVAAGNGANIAKIVQGGNRPINEFAREFQTWSNADLASRPAIRNQLLFDYAKDAAVLRDEVFSAVSGTTISSGESGGSCSAVVGWQMAELRSDGSLVTVGVFTCRSNFDNSPELQFLFTDVLGSTILAPGNFNPEGFRCETLAGQPGGKVDFLWVIDNSLSMGDEQQNVASTAAQFMDTLARSGVDWRVGVTTTESWVLSVDTQEVFGVSLDELIGHDELFDRCSGLRGQGFVAGNDAISLFGQYVTTDANCIDGVQDGIAPAGANVCGIGAESGLQSAVTVINNTAAGVSTCPAPNYRLRDDAEVVVVIVSDEEDFFFKEPIQVGRDTYWVPMDPNSPDRAQFTADTVDAFNGVGIPIFSIVGDQGVSSGGTCPDFDGLAGAEYGLGYIDVAAGTGGAFGSVCNNNLQNTIDAIVSAGIGVASGYVLSNAPITPSIRVAVNGQIVPRSRTNGWDYNADSNAIVFFRNLSELDTVAVGYKIWTIVSQ